MDGAREATQELRATASAEATGAAASSATPRPARSQVLSPSGSGKEGSGPGRPGIGSKLGSTQQLSGKTGTLRLLRWGPLLTLALGLLASASLATKFATVSLTRMGKGFQELSGNERAQERQVEEALHLLGPGKLYYYMGKGGDYCAGEGHWSHSWLCAAAEAKVLNRTLVLETNLCLPAVHEGRQVERPFGSYYDVGHLSRKLSIVPLASLSNALEAASALCPLPRYAARCKAVTENSGALSRAFNTSARVSELQAATETLVIRALRPRDFGFHVCRDNRGVIRRDYSLLRPPPELTAIADAIVKELGDFDAVHVRRGDKLVRRHWPNLDRDTRAPALLKTLPKFVTPGRHLYIATNEQTEGFFAPLQPLYKVHVLRDYQHLWNKTSPWYQAQAKASSQAPVFDSRMQVIVDRRVMSFAKKKVETFNDLTKDRRHGINW